jgi:hypothetical protein
MKSVFSAVQTKSRKIRIFRAGIKTTNVLRSCGFAQTNLILPMSSFQIASRLLGNRANNARLYAFSSISEKCVWYN